MTTPAPDHTTHDPLLIAAHLDGTLDARDATRVHDWLSGCSACVTLRSDLATLAVATREMAMPIRPRDFTLSAADAQRATARGWRHWMAVIASPRDSLTRPLAVGLTTLGLAGLVITAIPTASLFGSASSAGAAPGPQVEMTGEDAGATSLEAPIKVASPTDTHLEDGYGGTVPLAGMEGQSSVPNGGAESGRGNDKHAPGDASVSAPPAEGPSLLVLASMAMLLTGLALTLLRWGARRLGDG